MTRSHVTLTNPWDGYWRTRPKFWTTQRQFELAGYLERGYDDTDIARRMGTTRNAIMLARKRHSISSRTDLLWSARRVAVLLGIGCSKAVTRWIERGYLAGRQGQVRGPHRQWYVRYEDIVAFLENPETHHLWQPDRITDRTVREWTADIWTGPFLTVGEVAERCFVGHQAVNSWIQRGILPAVKYGNWWIRESDLDGFIAPGQQDRTPRPWTDDDDMTLLSMRAGGAHWNEIARTLHRWPGGCCRRWQQLQEREAA